MTPVNSNEPRDQLAEILSDETSPIHAAASRALEKMYGEWGTTPGLPTPAVAVHRMADFLDEEGWRPPPRVIEDRSELDTLRPGTLVREKVGAQRAWELNSANLVGAYKATWWTQPGSRSAYKSGQLQLPVTVLWEPEEAGQ